MATSEGWRGPLKEVKSEKAAPVSVRNETLCPATTPITRSSKSVCTGRTWGLELGLVTGITQAQLDHLSPHPRNHDLGCQGLPESGFWPIVVGPGVDPEIWWVLSEDNPFSSGSIVCRWGRVWWVAGGWGRT